MNEGWPALEPMHVDAPVVFRVAPMTSSPAFLSTGMLSPVTIDSSRLEAPLRSTPSTGTFSPGRTSTRSPRPTPPTGPGGRGLEPDQLLDRRRRPPAGDRLQVPAEEDQRDDDGGRVEVHLAPDPLGLAGAGEEEQPHAVGGRG